MFSEEVFILQGPQWKLRILGSGVNSRSSRHKSRDFKKQAETRAGWNRESIYGTFSRISNGVINLRFVQIAKNLGLEICFLLTPRNMSIPGDKNEDAVLKVIFIFDMVTFL